MKGDGSFLPTIQASFEHDTLVAGQDNKVHISGKFSEDVTESTIVAVTFYHVSNPNFSIGYTSTVGCTGKGCKIKAGDPFTQTVDVQLPDNKDTYLMVVEVSNSSTDIGCTLTLVTV
ncbi:3873_t:CDS:1 [Funneliformis mosseae]|uniref:3873_t:CDS:1 n=1 Tax=Funneliformis mosseae TaxID=27381 RepID=A0A9N9BGE7_FUNMO|nr:3873_t:CDS:1 [Funneliformis mosseae]